MANGCNRNKGFLLFLVIITILGSGLQSIVAMRMLEGEKWVGENSNILVIQSLPRGSVPPSTPNPCTHIPGRKGGRCTLETQSRVSFVISSEASEKPEEEAAAATAYPGSVVVRFGTASASKADHHRRQQNHTTLKKESAA